MFQDYMLAGATGEHHGPVTEGVRIEKRLLIRIHIEVGNLIELCIPLANKEPSERFRPNDVS